LSALSDYDKMCLSADIAGKYDSCVREDWKMGTYLNPGNSGFKRIIESEYIDKTGLIRLINNSIGTTKNLTCVDQYAKIEELPTGPGIADLVFLPK